jgi:hypothetical protein
MPGDERLCDRNVEVTASTSPKADGPDDRHAAIRELVDILVVVALERSGFDL